MNKFKEKSCSSLIPMIIVIVSMVNTLSIVSLIFWAVGISLTITILDRKGEGINIMSNTKRRIFLGIGMTITVCSLLDEINIISLILFGIGFVSTVMLVESSNTKEKKFE